MAARDGKVSGVDIVSIAISSLALVVSIVAGGVSYRAWTRPAPADPTYIPTFGQSGKPVTIDAGEGGHRFFAFLDKYPGRKIRIIARVDAEQVNVREKDLVSTYFDIPRKCKPEQECYSDSLVIEGTDGEDKPGIEYR
jgi:hypothetical protein